LPQVTLNSIAVDQKEKLLPRILIAAPQGHSGKTIIGIGLCDALSKRGFRVQPFKKGPDYIDPSWLSAAAGVACRNLDSFLMPEEKVVVSFIEACVDADIALIEGAMGLYDGIGLEGDGSSAHIARLLRTPVILVINAVRMTTSVAALVKGYQMFESDVNIVGVILNNVAGSRHESKLKAAVEHYCGISVLGVVPRDINLNIGERHLGLIPFRECAESASIIERIGNIINANTDINSILAVAKDVDLMPQVNINISPRSPQNVRIGVISDRVFTFYYKDNLEALSQLGAEIVFIDSLKDRNLSDIQGLYIGGGFPELFLEELEANSSLRHEISEAIDGGLPVYAECAGLMYLCRSIKKDSRLYEMVGVLSAEVEILSQPQGHGYTSCEVVCNNAWFPVGTILKGHEFHYSSFYKQSNLKFALNMKLGHGIDNKSDGIVYKNLFASYTHIHALGVPEWAESFCKLAQQYKSSKLVLAQN
jgi:cobyrinic acid a,c-diamide synthase